MAEFYVQKEASSSSVDQDGPKLCYGVPPLRTIGLVETQYSPNVVYCLPVRGNRTDLGNKVLAGIIGGQGESKIIIEEREEILKIAHPPINVLPGVKHIRYVHPKGGCRHQLHQPLGAFL